MHMEFELLTADAALRQHRAEPACMRRAARENEESRAMLAAAQRIVAASRAEFSRPVRSERTAEHFC